MADIIFPGEAPEADIGLNRLPNNVDWSFWQGDSQEFLIRFTDDQAAPLDITGYTAQAVIRENFTEPTSYSLTCTIQNTNEVKVYLSSAVSATIPAGSYAWNLQLTAPNGDVRTYLAGDVVVHAEVD